MRLTVLVENGPCEGLGCEHGLSLYVEHGGRRYLVDVGASELFARNAEKLGVDVTGVDAAIVSHGHYDHTGGLEAFFALNPAAPVYLRREAALNYYGGDGSRYIGMPEGICQRHPDRFRFTDGVVQIAPGVWLLPHITPGLAENGRRASLWREEDGKPVPDDFRHEQCVAFETEGGLVLLTSCSHAGIAVCVREALEMLPGKRVRAVVGGFHLIRSREPETLVMDETGVRALGRELVALGVEEIYTGHCTGQTALAMLRDELKEKCRGMIPGTVMNWE